MVCKNATGSCTTSSDGSCVAPKSLDVALVLHNLTYTEAEVGFTIAWGVSGIDPEERVKVAYRDLAGTIDRTSAPLSYGFVSIGPLPPESFFRVWARLENALNYGVWTELDVKTYPVNSADFRYNENSQYTPTL